MSDKDKLIGDDSSLEILFKKNDEKNDLSDLSHLKIESKSDTLDLSLDELSDLSEHWKRNREAGRSAKHIRIAMVEIAKEIVALDECF